MLSSFLTAAFLSTFAIRAVIADLAVNDPAIYACATHETKVTWQPGKAPYNLIIVDAADPCGDAIVDGGDTSDTWMDVKTGGLKAGQQVQISILDADGAEGWSAPLTVREGCPASSAVPSSSAAVPSSSALSQVQPIEQGTTLVVTPTLTVGNAAETPSPSVQAIGAANLGSGFGISNAAAVPRHLSIPALTFTALGGAVALLL